MGNPDNMIYEYDFEGEGVNEKAESSKSFIERKYIETSLKAITEDLKLFISNNLYEKRKNQRCDCQEMVNKLLSNLESRVCFLEDEIKSKNILINKLLEKSVMHDDHKSPSYTNRIKKSDLKQSTENNYVFPKRTSSVKKPLFHNNGIQLVNRYDVFEDITTENEIEEIPEENFINKFNKIIIDETNVTNRRKPSRKQNDSSQEIKRLDKKSVVAILGDSIVKEVKGHLLTTEEHKVVVKSFSGASTECMYDHANPTLRMKPEIIILHCGTNDLSKHKDNDPETVAGNIMNLAHHCIKNTEGKTSVIVSSITSRDDKHHDKVAEVNSTLKVMCQERNIGYIDNSNILPKLHLNRSKLHLNRKGSSMLARNFKEVYSN